MSNEKHSSGIRQTITRTVFISMIILFVAGIYLGTTTFNNGFHNLDRGWNLKLINANYNLSLVEFVSDHITIKTEPYSPEELITLGYAQYKKGFLIIAGSCLMLGLFLGFWLGDVR